MSTIFISYRRTDSTKDARAVYERLRREFVEHQVFIDLEAIAPGDDFISALERVLEGCDALIALVGHNWVGKLPNSEISRLQSEGDFVRIELSTAFRRGIRVFPVLLDGSVLPSADQLPDELLPILRRQALALDYARFDEDLEKLARALRNTLNQSSSSQGFNQRGDPTRLEVQEIAFGEKNERSLVLAKEPQFLAKSTQAKNGNERATSVNGFDSEKDNRQPTRFGRVPAIVGAALVIATVVTMAVPRFWREDQKEDSKVTSILQPPEPPLPKAASAVLPPVDSRAGSDSFRPNLSPTDEKEGEKKRFSPPVSLIADEAKTLGNSTSKKIQEAEPTTQPLPSTPRSIKARKEIVVEPQVEASKSDSFSRDKNESGDKSYWVLLGSFREVGEATALAEKVATSTGNIPQIEKIQVSNQEFFRVAIGRYISESEARVAASKMERAGFVSSIIRSQLKQN